MARDVEGAGCGGVTVGNLWGSSQTDTLRHAKCHSLFWSVCHLYMLAFFFSFLSTLYFFGYHCLKFGIYELQLLVELVSNLLKSGKLT